MGGPGWPAQAARELAVKRTYKSLWNWSLVQSGPDPDLNQAAGKILGFVQVRQGGSPGWAAGDLARWNASAVPGTWQMAKRDMHSYREFPFLPSLSSQVTAEAALGSGRCWCEKEGEWTLRQSAGSDFLSSGLSNPPTLPNPEIPSRMRICWCRYAYVHTHAQTEVSVCTRINMCELFFTRMPTCPLDSLSWGQPCFVSVGKFQTRCTPLLQSSISFT